jgi:hypothetical protein
LSIYILLFFGPHQVSRFETECLVERNEWTHLLFILLKCGLMGTRCRGQFSGQHIGANECTAADLPIAVGAVTEAVAAGDLTPDEAQSVAALLELQRRAIETAELEQRIAALEARHAPAA